MVHALEHLVVRHTHRLPSPTGPAGDGAAATRRFDAALLTAGFKLSGELVERLSGLAGPTVVETAVRTLATVRELVGDHVRHNVYFVDFPDNVPDTLDFWRACVADALADDATRARTAEQLSAGVLDLLTLPSYGRYPHTYEESSPSTTS